jgi:MFS family permease
VPEPSNIARITHNLGLATWFGGALFGQIALNPTISRISDRRERGRVLNESWGRFNAVIFATIAATVLTWRLGGLRGDAELKAPALARAKNLLLGGAVINGIASGVMGPGSRKRPPRARRKVEPQSRRGRSPRRRPPKVPPGLSA